MATTVKDCLQVAEARRKARKVYMMMETAVYTREFLFVKEMADKGELGKIQFLRGSHQQNMSLPGWPDYWYGFPHALRDPRGEPVLAWRQIGGIRGGFGPGPSVTSTRGSTTRRSPSRRPS